MRSPVALVLLLAAGPVPALEPAGVCVLLGESQKIVTREEAAAEAGAVIDVFPSALPNGFVVSEAFPEGLAIQALTHCPSGEYLMTIMPADVQDRVLARFDEMMADSRGYTLDQISAEMQRLGAFSRRGSGGTGGCDCAAAFGE